MSTLKQIESNRANSRKSTGPKTPEGKARSSRNATTHGLLAASVVLDGESKTRFYSLLNSLIDELKPVGPCEYALVESMAVARWRQMRLWGFQKAALAEEVRRHQADSTGEGAPADNHVASAIAFRNLGQSSRALDLMHRYETAYFRMFGRSMDRFKQNRARPAQQFPSKLVHRMLETPISQPAQDPEETSK
jgi:hypothetical protein